MKLANKVAIVTGASRGIGKEIALEFARCGARVVICGRNNRSVEAARNEILEEGGSAIGVVADVTKLEDTNELIRKTLDSCEKVDILVNNAGITRDGLLMRMKEEDWDEVLDTNLKGTFNCIKSAVRSMLKQQRGVIINITSVIGLAGNAGQVNYAASKAGIIGLTKSVAKELASRNIVCNAIAPGYIETDMTAHAGEAVEKKLKAQIPLQRMGSVKDIARAAVFLASEDASYITGQVLNVDGGMVMS